MSTYSGHVSPHGQSATRELPQLSITKMSVGPMDNNTYLLVCHATGEALLIDAANEPDRIAALIESPTEHGGAAGRLSTVVTTHRHSDHWQALASLAHSTGAAVVAGDADVAGLPVPAHRGVRHGQRIAVGVAHLDVIALRGHTPGSIALAYHDPHGGAHLFTGDSLFPGGPGKTQSPQDFASLLGDLESRVFDVFPDDTWVYPGHGDDTTLGAERPHLDEWRARGW